MNPVSSVQALRALAAVLVVLVHSTHRAGDSFNVPELIHFGAVGKVGVDVFFVISGFIMYVSTYGQKKSASSFFRDRLLRVYPMYWLATFSYIGLSSLSGRGIRPSLGSLSLSLAAIPHFDSSGGMDPVLFVGWTLTYEMFFYTLMSLCLNRSSAHVPLTCSLLTIMVLIGYIVHPRSAILVTYTNPLLLEFVFGLFLGWIWWSGYIQSRLTGLALLVSSLFLIVHSFLLEGTDVDGFSRVLEWGVPSLMFIAGALAFEDSRILRSRALQNLGASSFSIYLIHPHVLLAFASIWRRIGFHSITLYLSAAVFLCISVGFLCYLGLEIRISNLARRTKITRKSKNINESRVKIQVT